MPTIPRSSRSSLLLAGMYPPSTRPVILTVLPHGVRAGVTLVSTILAGVITVADPVAGRIVGEPAYEASMIREDPGASVAVQRPSGPVVTADASLNASEPLSGAVMTAICCPASGRPELVISSPCTFTDRPNPTTARVARFAVDLPQLRRRSRCRCAVVRAARA